MSSVLLALAVVPAMATDYVVGGTEVPEGDWLDAAAIAYNHDAVNCSGVLIAPNVVLTAGHCAQGIRKVVLGTTDYTDPDAEWIAVGSTYKYPSYWGNGDIAVLVLEEDSAQPPRPIALDCILDDFLYDGATVTIVGYGATDAWGTEYGSILMEADTVVVDHDCTDIAGGCWSAISPGGEIGAGGDGVDSCYGDSGGPLYLWADGEAYLIGLTSRSWDWVEEPCLWGGIYTRPDYFVDWIESESGVTLPRPECEPVEENAAPVPTADPIEVVQGEAGSTLVEANDPDVDDVHSFTILDGPQHGTVLVDGTGLVEYTADADYVGDDDFTVVVTDDGDPPLAGEVVVDVTVTEADTGDPVDTGDSGDTDTDDPGDSPADEDPDDVVGGGCGCAAGGLAAGWLWGLGLVVLIRRRR